MSIECSRRIDYLASQVDQLGITVVPAGRKLMKDDYVKALRKYYLNKYYGDDSNIPWHLKFMLSIECLQLCRRINDLKDADKVKVWESEDWIAEPKIDGCRMAIVWNSSEKKFHFYSRNNSAVDYLPQDYSDTILVTCKNFNYPDNFVLDAEVISSNPTVATNTQCLTQLQSTAALLNLNAEDSKKIQKNNPLKFIVFDCMYNGSNCIDKPWTERHSYAEKLANVLKESGFNCELNKVVRNTKDNKYAKKEFYDKYVAQGGEGCFTGDCRVMMADLTQKKIKDIVVGDRVLSYDHANNKITESTVTNVFNNGKLKGSEWVTVYPETVVRGVGGRCNERFGANTFHRIVATQNHKFYNGEEYIPITECKNIYKLNYYLDDYREKALHGWLLSDASIDKRNLIRLSQKLGDYFSFTENLFNKFKCDTSINVSGKGSKTGSFNIRHDVTKHITREKFNNTLIKEWLSNIDPITFAYMFMGDGSGSNKNISLSMCSYSIDEVNLLIHRLNEIGIDNIRIKVDKRVNSGSGVDLVFRKAESQKLINWFGMYVHPSMRYKLKSFSCPDYIEPPIIAPTIKPQLVEVTNGINNKDLLNNNITRYDIEVENTHNYFVEGVLVHNCVLKNINAKYHATSSRTIDCVKVKRSTADNEASDIDAFITDYVVGNDNTRNENTIVGFVFSVKLEKDDGTIVMHPIAVCSNFSDFIKEDATKYNSDGSVTLNPEYYGRVATVKGQNISARNLRLTHAVLEQWRPEKSSTECEILKESFLKSLVF